MLISRQYRFVFAFVPRAASTSLHQALAPYADIDLHSKHTHAPLEFALKYVSSEEFDQFHRAIVTRNPWDWLVSLYLYLIQNPVVPHHYLAFTNGFREFCRRAHQITAFHQASFLRCDGEKVTAHVLRFGSLEADLGHFASLCGFAPPKLENLNRLPKPTDRPAYQCFYDDSLIAYVADRWDEDIQLAGHQFESLDGPEADPAALTNYLSSLRERAVALAQQFIDDFISRGSEGQANQIVQCMYAAGHVQSELLPALLARIKEELLAAENPDSVREQLQRWQHPNHPSYSLIDQVMQ